MGKRQEAALETRQKIVDAVRALLRQRRADEINIEDITQRAGVAKGTFYTHFKRKEDVISVLAMECYTLLLDDVLSSAAGTFAKLRRYLVHSARIIEKNTLQIAQNWAKSVAAPIAGELCGVEKYNFDRENILNLLKSGAASGELLPDTPCEALADGIMEGYYGAVFVWCLTSGETPLERALESFCETILQPILARYTNT